MDKRIKIFYRFGRHYRLDEWLSRNILPSRIGGVSGKEEVKERLRITLPKQESSGSMDQNSMSASVSDGAPARIAARRRCQSE